MIGRNYKGIKFNERKMVRNSSHFIWTDSEEKETEMIIGRLPEKSRMIISLIKKLEN